MKTLLREMMVKCLVHARKGVTLKDKNAMGEKCKGLKVTDAYKKQLVLHATKLAAGVSDAKCLQSKTLIDHHEVVLQRNKRISTNFETHSQYDLSFEVYPQSQ